MYFVKTSYKTYKGSSRASMLSALGAAFKAILWICLSSIIMLLIAIPTAANPNYKEDIKIAIPACIAIGLVSFIIGVFMQKRAEKLGALDFENKIKTDFEFVKKMAKETPEHKEWYMSQNLEYENYVLSVKENLEQSLENKPNKITILLRNVFGILLLIIFVFGGMYFLRSI